MPSDHSCKVLTSQYTGEQSEMYKQSDTVDTNTEGQNPTKKAKKMYKVGVQHTPQQFFELAKDPHASHDTGAFVAGGA